MLLGGLKAQWAALISLAVAMLVALIVYGMPFDQTALSAIGAAAVGLVGREGDLCRKVLGWSLVLILAMCALVNLQSTAVLDWMVVK